MLDEAKSDFTPTDTAAVLVVHRILHHLLPSTSSTLRVLEYCMLLSISYRLLILPFCGFCLSPSAGALAQELRGADGRESHAELRSPSTTTAHALLC